MKNVQNRIGYSTQYKDKLFWEDLKNIYLCISRSAQASISVKICHSKINKWKHQKDSEGDVNVLGWSDQLMSCQRTCCAQHPVICRQCWLSVGTSVTVTVRVSEERVDTHHTVYLYNATEAIASL